MMKRRVFPILTDGFSVGIPFFGKIGNSIFLLKRIYEEYCNTGRSPAEGAGSVFSILCRTL